jgi:hypothetical protein
MMSRTLILVSVVVLFAVSAQAEVTASKNRYQIHINHADDAVSICRVCTKKQDFFAEMRLDNEMPIAFRVGDEAEIWIDDPNPLLFSYTVGTVEVFAHPSAEAARQFAQELAKVLTTLPITPAAATSEKQIEEGEQAQSILRGVQGAAATTQRITAATNQLQKASEARKQIESELQDLRTLSQATDLTVPDTIEISREASTKHSELREAAEVEANTAARQRTELETAIRLYPLLQGRIEVTPPVDVVEEGLKKLGFSRQYFEDLKKKVGDLNGLVNAIPKIALESVDRGNWPHVKEKVEKWQLDERIAAIDASYERIVKAYDALDFADASVEATIVRNARGTQDEYEKLADSLKEFRQLVNAIGTPTAVRFKADGKLVIMDYDALVNRDYPLNVDRVELPKAFRADVDDAVKKRGWRSGKFIFKNSPLHPVRLTAGPALVYSLLKRKEYFADKRSDTDPTLVIKQKPKERLTGEMIGVMLNIIPRRWDDPFFGGSFQVGVTAGKDSFGAAAGVGIRVSDIFSVGVGALVQRQDRLAAGLAVADTLQSTTDLKLDKEYKAGAYFHVTTHIKLTK